MVSEASCNQELKWCPNIEQEFPFAGINLCARYSVQSIAVTKINQTKYRHKNAHSHAGRPLYIKGIKMLHIQVGITRVKEGIGYQPHLFVVYGRISHLQRVFGINTSTDMIAINVG